MKHVNNKLSGLLLLSAAACTLQASVPATIGPVTPYIAIRSQGYDAARELAGWTQQVNQADRDCNYSSFYVLPEYTSTFRSNNIFNSLFGTCTTSTFTGNNCNTGCNTGCNTNNNCKGGSLRVSGSRVADRGTTDLLAEYFYLPTDYQSTLNFNPRIQNVNVDLNWYWGLNSWVEGLFFRLHIPVTWTRWNLNFCETNIFPGTASTGTTPTTIGGGYAPGYFAFSGIPTTSLLTSFASYANGNAPAAFVDPTPAAGTITFNPLNFARITNCARTLGGVADLQAILGYNFVECEDHHFGVGLFTSAPTGSRPTGQYLFEPVVGNGGSWALGAHITSHRTLWTSCDEDRSLGFYLDCNITHLFKAKQTRTFDLVSNDGICKPLSRYMLAETLGTPVTGLTSGDAPLTSTVPNAQFQNEYTPVANFTTQQVKVSVGVQGDLAAQFTYVHGNFTWDLGYNFWGRSCEKICVDCNTTCTPCNTNCNTGCPVATPTPFVANKYALKGDSSVYGEGTDDDDGLALNGTPVPLSATQTSDSFADITGGSNFFNDANFVPVNATTPTAGLQNLGVENAQPAWNGSLIGSTPVAVVASAPIVQISTSNPAVFLTAANIANCQGTRGISNKIYTHFGWEFDNCDCWTPFVGIGGFAEFGPNACKSNCNTACNTSVNCNTNCNTSCNTGCGSSCLNAAISQWGIWAKFGVTYN